MNEGYIKLFRKFTKWEWYSDINTKTLFLHLLLTANHEDRKWKGIEVKKGQVIVGRKKLSEELNLSERQIRTAIKHLISTNEVTTKTTNKFMIITLINWGKYQDYDSRTTIKTTNRVTNERPSNDQQVTTNNNEIIKEYIYVYNNAHAREENFCHLGSLFKNVSCVMCMKKNNCPHPESIEFKLTHEESFEEYDKRRTEELQKFISEANSRGDPIPEKYIPLFDCDWLERTDSNKE